MVEAAGVTGWLMKEPNSNPTAIANRRNTRRMGSRRVERRVIINVCPRQRAEKGWKFPLL
jgi:hypothetical protein